MLKEITALYIRLSMEDADLSDDKQESFSVKNQRLFIDQFLKANPQVLRGESREFVDDGFSGTNFERPAFQEMLELIRNGQVKCIIVKDFSRFGRNYIEVGNYLEQLFPVLNVRFISVADQYDSYGNKGDVPGIDVVFKNIIHDYYSKELSRKVLQTKRGLAKKGLFLGGIPPYGYLRDPQDKYHLIVDREAAKEIRKIFAYAIDGKSYSEIARRLNQLNIDSPAKRLWKLGIRGKEKKAEQVKGLIWYPQAVRRVLSDDVVLGNITNHKVERKQMGKKGLRCVNSEECITVSGMHEPIIETPIYELARHIIEKGKVKEVPKRNAPYRLLSGLLKCEICKRNLIAEGNKYICRHARSENKPGHMKVKVSESDLLMALANIIYFSVKLQGKPEDHAAKTVLKAKPEIADINQEVEKRKLMELYEQYSEGRVSKEFFLKQKKLIQNQMKQENKEGMTYVNQEKKSCIESLEHIVKLEDTSWITKDLLHDLIEKIEISPKSKVKIVWKVEDWLKL